MVQTEAEKEGKKRKKKNENHLCSFPARPLLFLCFHPLQHPLTVQVQSNKILNQSTLRGNKNEAFGLGIFILICVLAKDKRKVGKQTMQGAVEKKIIIVGESRALSDRSD